MPPELVKIGDRLRVEEDDEKLVFSNPEDDRIVYTVQKAAYKGDRVLPNIDENQDSVKYNALKKQYKDSDIALEFI